MDHLLVGFQLPDDTVQLGELRVVRVSSAGLDERRKAENFDFGVQKEWVGRGTIQKEGQKAIANSREAVHLCERQCTTTNVSAA